jgi:hypothetical protein
MSFAINKNAINRSGRVKGVPNKSTAELKQIFKTLLETNLEQLQNDFEQLKPSERIKFTLQVAEFLIPKLKATDLNIEAVKEFEPIIIQMGNYGESDN